MAEEMVAHLPQLRVEGKTLFISLMDDLMRRTHVIDLGNDMINFSLFMKDDGGYRKVGLRFVRRFYSGDEIMLLASYHDPEDARRLYDLIEASLGEMFTRGLPSPTNDLAEGGNDAADGATGGALAAGSAEPPSPPRHLSRWRRYARRGVLAASILIAFAGGAVWAVSNSTPLPPAGPLAGGAPLPPNLAVAPPLGPTTAPGLAQDVTRLPPGIPVSVDDAFPQDGEPPSAAK